MILLREDQVRALSKASEAVGGSRSAFVRLAIDYALEDSERFATWAGRKLKQRLQE
jgi:hypothetical protein